MIHGGDIAFIAMKMFIFLFEMIDTENFQQENSAFNISKKAYAI